MFLFSPAQNVCCEQCNGTYLFFDHTGKYALLGCLLRTGAAKGTSSVTWKVPFIHPLTLALVRMEVRHKHRGSNLRVPLGWEFTIQTNVGNHFFPDRLLCSPPTFWFFWAELTLLLIIAQAVVWMEAQQRKKHPSNGWSPYITPGVKTFDLTTSKMWNVKDPCEKQIPQRSVNPVTVLVMFYHVFVSRAGIL